MSDTRKVISVNGLRYKLLREGEGFRNPYGKRWAKMALTFLSETLAVDKYIHLADMRVLLKIVGTMGQGECKGRRVFVNQAGIAKDLNMTPGNVSRSIKKLLERGYLFRGEGLDKRYYSLNAELAWYGSDNEAHTKAIQGQKRITIQ